ncbi:hypothetical protein ACWGDE_03100 [Streptomyces sp. NPDC054956]
MPKTKVTRRQPERQNEQAWCLAVVTNAVVCWHGVYAGSGNDMISGGNGADALNGGPGTDTCSAGPGDTVTTCP